MNLQAHYDLKLARRGWACVFLRVAIIKREVVLIP